MPGRNWRVILRPFLSRRSPEFEFRAAALAAPDVPGHPR